MFRTPKRLLTAVGTAGLVSGMLFVAPAAAAGESQTYVVLYSASAVPSDAAKSITSAGGTLVYSYNEIGVAIARSTSLSFTAQLAKDKRVEGVSASAGFAQLRRSWGFIRSVWPFSPGTVAQSWTGFPST